MCQQTILLVDDNPTDRALFSQYLRRSKGDAYRILEVGSGKMALECLKQETPDCILLDCGLLDMGGLDLLAALKDEKGLQRFPVIMLTGSSNAANAVDAMKQGAQDYLAKDVTTAESLVHSIDNAIDKYSLLRLLERKLEELRTSEERLEEAQQVAHVGSWELDLTTQRITWSKEMFRLLSLVPEQGEPDYATHLALFVPEDAARLDAGFQYAMCEGIGYAIDIQRVALEGETTRWFHAVGKPKLDARGKVVQLVGTLLDVTERKSHAREIQHMQVLRESEARFRQLTDTAPVLVWTTGLDTHYDYFNKPWLDFTGRSLEAEVGNGWTEGVHSDDLQRLDVYLSSFEAHQPFRREYRLRRHDGQYRWLLDIGTPRFSPEGTFLGYIGSCIDITDQKIIQEQLAESQKLESMGRLAGGIAHDFNNLLTAILGYTEIACDTLPEESEVLPFLNNVTAAAERAAELTKQLLMYARRQMVEFTTFDINNVILKMYPLLRRIIGEQYELVTMLAEDVCCVNASASQMEQVLTNLVVNARDAMLEGGRILIETTCVTLDAAYAENHIGVIPGEYVMYSVSDTGIGMTTDVRNRIFEPFYTTKDVGKGTGLGLATCYGIIKQSKGNIWIYSEPGQGTTFKVYLPRVHNAAHSKPTSLPDHLPEGTETILLVDDEPMVRDIAARTLRRQGYRVLEASSGAEALYLQSEWPGEIDLLLSDVVMPLMGGKELAQRLKELHPKLKVLYMSGYTQNVILHQGVLKPGVSLLAKPFSAAGLCQKVRQVLSVF